MPAAYAQSAGDVLKAAASLRAIRPAYGPMIDYYGKLFSAQEASRRRVAIQPVVIEERILAAKTAGNRPLIDLSQFTVDFSEAVALIADIAVFATETNPELADAARRLTSAVEGKTVDFAGLIDALLNADDTVILKAAGTLGAGAEALSAILYNGILPSITACARQLAADYLSADHEHETGCCPVCGSPPVLSTLEQQGKRFLFCRFCWTRWAVRRMSCPYCQSTDGRPTTYLHSDQEPEWRIDRCQRCCGYLKTVDLRGIDRLFYPPLEQVTSLHLDVLANQPNLNCPD